MVVSTAAAVVAVSLLSSLVMSGSVLTTLLLLGPLVLLPCLSLSVSVWLCFWQVLGVSLSALACPLLVLCSSNQQLAQLGQPTTESHLVPPR